MVLDVLLDAVIDTVKLLPFLFLTYLLMEYLEHKTGDKSAQALRRMGHLGPLFGGAVGVVPQCGFSAAAASLFSGGVITLGTLLAVFLSTSDEMLPIFISEAVNPFSVLKILVTKMAMGIATGFAVDLILVHIPKLMGVEKDIHDLCEAEHCHCDDEEDGILKPALRHTLHITLFIFLISIVIGLLVEGIGEHAMATFLTRRRFGGVVLAAVIGLIPNCAASVMLTEFYLKGILAAGQMMAGLLVGAGVGLLVLFRTNRHLKENIGITVVLFVCGILWGLLIERLGITFV
ncbi:MAG: arsenic efflux protein [Eubacterium sp.]|nr:arsenic efflux protein [Eubacterium sp.]